MSKLDTQLALEIPVLEINEMSVQREQMTTVLLCGSLHQFSPAAQNKTGARHCRHLNTSEVKKAISLTFIDRTSLSSKYWLQL